MELTIDKLVVGPLESNCYILGAEGRAIVIDPGAEGERILRKLQELNLQLDFVINTHGHADHIGGNSDLLDNGAKLLIHQLDAEMLAAPEKNLSIYTQSPDEHIRGPEAHSFLEDGQVIKWAGPPIEVIHTPGHTPGSICLLMENNLFSGDTLFAGGVGRTDLPGGNTGELMRSIKERIFTLDLEVRVFPGHGPSTSVGYEKSNNPFIS